MYTRTSTPKPLSFVMMVFMTLTLLPAVMQAQQQTKKPLSNEQYLNLLKESDNTISFHENKGQWLPQVLATGHTNIGDMVVKKNGEIYFLSVAKDESGEHEGEAHDADDDDAGHSATAVDKEAEEEENEKLVAHGWGMFLDGYNPKFTVSKSRELETKYNYFQGNDPKYWASDVAAYGEMSLNNIYDGIDLRMYSQDKNHIEFDWVVNPGASYKNIKMRFKGQEGIRVDENGNLAVKLHFDEVKFDIPEAYQVIDGKKVPVAISFFVDGDVATFKAEGKVDSRYPLVIDPSLKWGVWVDNNDNNFDEYLFAVDIDASGNVYCGGAINVQLTNSYIGAAVYGYDATYNDGGTSGNGNNRDGIIYVIKNDGTALQRITYFGSSSPDAIYGLSMSPDFSTVMVSGYASGNIPTTGNAFDNSRSGSDGFVAIFNSTLSTLQYSSYLGGTGSGDRMVSIRALSNNSYVVGGRVNAAVPANYISNAYDASYDGNYEMYIAKFTAYNTLTFGTYVGGNNDDDLNDLQVLSDGSLVFSGYTSSSTGSFPGLINSAGSSNTNQDGVVGVIPANGGTFSMLSRIGGSGNDQFNGLAIGPNDTIFLTGYTTGTFPLGTGASASTRFSANSSGNEEGIIGKIPRDGKPGATDPWVATYFGGSGNDRGNTIRTYAYGSAVMVFGETGSNNFPTKNLSDGGTSFYDSTFNGNTWDMFWMALGTDLKTQFFATYVGGSQNDYLGETGVPAGSNHFVVEGDSLIILGTTSHSSTIEPVVVGPTTGPLAVFDASRSNDNNNDDIHLVFKWRIGNLFNYDYGDAPASYGTTCRHGIVNTLRLGALEDNEDFYPALPGTRANADDLAGTAPDDEDAIIGTQVMIQDNATTYSVTVPLTNGTGLSAYLMGWIDFNRNGVFDNNEVAKATIANNATSGTLTWSGFDFSTQPTVDTSYLRLRLTTDGSFNVNNPSPSNPAVNGEVEDYLVIRYHCENLATATVTPANPTSCVTANGSITISNANLLPNVTYGVYYRVNNGSLLGPFYLTASNSGVLVINNLGPGTYTTVQVFHPTNPLCGDSLRNPVTLTNPTVSAPGVSASPNPICSGATLTLTATGQVGASYSWTGPSSFTSTSNPATRANVTTAMSGTYSVTQTVNGCTSPAGTVSVTVNPSPAITANTSTPTLCAGGTINLTSSPSGGNTPYTYTWSGPASFSSTVQNPTITGATTAMSGNYNVTVTTANGCTASATTPNVTVNAGPTVTANTSTPTLCSGGTISLTSTPSPAGTYTYSWSGPSSFASSVQNPTRANATTSYSGVYTVTVTSTNGCTATASTSNITVNQTPSVTATSGSPSYCTGSTISLSATPSNGTSPYTYNWSGPSSFTSTSQSPIRTNATTAMAGTYNVTVTDANGCSATAVTPNVTVNQTPTVTAASGSPTYCSGSTISLTSTATGGTTPYTYSWSGPSSFTSSLQNPTRASATTGMSGIYSVTVTSANGCSATASTANVTVNQSPSLSAASGSPTYCAGTTMQFTSTPSSGTTPYTYNWSGPSSFTSTVQNPSRANAITAYSGTYNVTVTDANGCTATATTGNVTVNPGLSVTAGSNSPVCSGGTLNLTSSASGGTSPFTYNWSGPSFTSAQQNPSRAGATAAMAGSYNVTITDNNGCSGTGTTSVTVNSTASVTVNSNTPVCSGLTLNLSATLSGGASPFTYSWSGPASFTSTSATPSRTNTLVSYSGTYNVTVTDANGCSGTGSNTVVINQSPAVTAASGSPSYCSGATITLTSTITGGATPYTYSWSGPSAFTSTLQNPTRANATTAMSGVYNVTVTDANGCSGSASTNNVTVNQSPTITASSNTPVCETKNINLTSTPVSGTSPYSYLWSGPSSYASTAQNPTRTNALSTYSGSYSVTLTDANGCTATATTSVSVLPKPGLPTATSNTPVCTGQTLNLFGSGNTGASWNWYGPSSFASTLQNPSVTSVTTAYAGTYGLYQTLSGCTSDTAFTTVVINTTPSAPTAAASPNPICTGNTLTLTATGQLGATFNWTGPNGYTSTGTPVTRTNVTTAMAGNYTVTQTVTGCTSPSSAPVNVVINTTPTAPTPTSNTPACYGDTLKLFAATVSGATYSWSGPSAYTSAVQNPTRPLATPAMSGVYSLTVTVNGCSSTSSATVAVVVNSCPPVAVNDNYSTNEDTPLNITAPGVKANDYDPANPQQPLTVTTTPVVNVSHGSLTLNSNGSFTYTPSLNYNGLDSFQYQVCDNEVPAACDTATAYITVIPVNDPPVIPDTTVTTPEDNPKTVCLPITDPESATQLHSATVCGNPLHGTISTPSVNNGSNPHTICITYTPTTNFNGSDSFCVIVCDNGSPTLCDTAIVHVNVTPVNDPPVAVNDNYTTNEDTPITTNSTTGVRNNDNDNADGNPVTSLTVNTTPVINVSHGTLTLNGDGSFTYTPTPNYNGVDSFQYVVCDNGTPLPSLCDTATAYITIVDVNDPPVVPDTTVTTPEDNPKTVCLNITDPESATQTHFIQSIYCGPNSGTISGTNISNGSIPHVLCLTYTPNTNFNGSDSVCLVICDNGTPQLCDTTHITIVVTPVNDPPVAVNDIYVSCIDTAIKKNVLVNDFDVDGPAIYVQGTLCGPFAPGATVNLLLNGNFTYTPPVAFNGVDSFCYVICDNGTPNLCDTAIAVVDYRCTNLPPIAGNDNFTTPEDVTLTNTVTGNDYDQDGGPLVYDTTLVVTPSHGTVTITSTGTFTYVPTPNYYGTDSFVYRVCDTDTPVLCTTATVYITVTPVNDPPQIPDTTVTTCEDCPPTTVCLPITDVDVTDLHFATTGCNPLHGTVSNVTVNNLSNPHTVCLTYASTTNYNGTDSFCVVVCDNGFPTKCDTSVVTIIVTPVNDPPVAVNDNYTTNEDTPITTNSVTGVRNNDNDNADGNPVTSLTVNTTPVVNVSHGSLTLNGDGSFNYTPTANYFGTDSFQYVVCDNGTPLPSLCDTATAYITIVPVNDPPYIPDTTVTTCEDCPPTTVCLPITDVDVTDFHFASTLCNPAHGTVSNLTVNNTSNPHSVCVTYTSTTNYNGTDSFCVVVCDNGTPSKCDTSVVTIIVTPVNDPPVAVNDNYTTNEDTPITTNSVTGVRNNDNDNADGNPVTTLVVNTTPIVNVSHGTLLLSNDGSFLYTPALNFNGVDSFQYVVCDNGTPLPSLCDTATAYITVVPVNDPPQIPDTTVTTCEDCPPVTVCLPITDPDVTDQHYALTSCNPAHGSVSGITVNNLSNPHTVCLTYTSVTNYNGTDSFCVVVCDNGVPAKCDTSVVTIIVTPVNDPPVAVNDNYTTNEDVAIVTNSVTGVRNNDNDNADGNPVTSLTVNTTPVVNVSHGSLTLNSDGSFTYTPTANYFGTDSFQYVVCDNGTPLPSLCDTATAYITIVSVNDPPMVPDTTVTVPEDSVITVCVPITDADGAANIHTVSICDAPDNGSITSGPVVSNGSLPHTVCITYRPGANFNGLDSICLTVCDNGIPFLCDNSIIHIIVTPVNDPPVAVNDNYTTNEDTPLTVGSSTGVRANDNDNADGNPVTSLTVNTTPLVNVSHGTLTLNSNGSFIYTPTANYFGLDSFQYIVCDNGTPLPSLCDTATAYITVVPVNDPPQVPDTTITTCEDCPPVTTCLHITDNDSLDLHSATVLCPGQLGTVSNVTINQSTHTLCFDYKSFLNLNGVDSICVVVCDNGNPTLCDTTHITIIVNPVNDPPYADTIRVTTYENRPIGVNVASATGDLEGDPLTYSYQGVIPGGGTYAITGNGAIVVTPDSGFTGVFTIPYGVCDLSPYPVNVLCDSAVIIVTVLPTGDTLINHAPVANNDYVTIPMNTSANINEFANDYDPDGDALQVTVTCNPKHGSYTLNANGTVNYVPATGFYGFDTICYTICDPTAAHNPKPLCSSAVIVISVSHDPESAPNDPPVAVDDYAFICADANAVLHLLSNDYDPNGNAITVATVYDNFDHGSLINVSFGNYVYTPNAGYTGYDTLYYRICDNGVPSLCDTARAVVLINGTPVITPSVTSLTTCSNDSVNITFTSNVAGSTFIWTATNGTNGTGDIHRVVTNNTSAQQIITYTVTAVSPSGCGSSAINIPVTVNPRPTATATSNGNLFCSGEQVVINATSNVTNTTYTWSGTNGTSGTGSLITDNPVNATTANITVTYSIVPTAAGCTGDTLKVNVTVKPRPVLTATPPTQTSCSGSPITINISSTIVGTTLNWTGSNGNSGNTSTINDSPFNNGNTNITVTYTINGSLNGCSANTTTATVVVRPAVVADAGADKSVSACSASCVTIGGSPTGARGTGALTYTWTPSAGLNDSTLANPTACGLSTTTTYTVRVTDAAGCFSTDQVTITVTPSSLTAEAGAGGAVCLNSGDSVMLGGFPTAVGGTPVYTYTWAPTTGLNLTNAANPSAYPSTTTTYHLTVTDQAGCQSVDSAVVTVFPALVVNAGADTTLCAGTVFNLGDRPTASGGSGVYTYNWSPTVGVSDATTSNPQAIAFATTTYQLTVTDNNGCSGTDNALITINPAPIANAGPDKTLSTCAGDSVTIGDVPAVTGGTPPYTYSWFPTTGLSDSTIANPVVKGLTATQTFILTVTDSKGCSSTDYVTINVVNSTLSANAGTNKQICYGNCVQLGRFPTAIGGFPPYTYTWTGGSLDDSTDANPTACPTATTVYTVVVRDNRGCTATSNVTVTVNLNPIANAGPDTSVCSGSSITIGGSPSATSGTTPYTYSWNPSTGLSNTTAANPMTSPTIVTTYQLVVTDSKGCAGVDEVVVTPRTNPIVDAGNDKTLTACAGDTTFIGGIPVVVSGGSAPFTYTWSPATGLNNATAQNPLVTGITATTSYQVLVRDTFGCTGVDYVIVNVVPSTLQAEAGNSGVVCAAAGSPVQLGGAPTAAGGTSPYKYHWSPAAPLNDSTASNPIATVSTTTTFYVTVTDAKGCTSVDSVKVTQNASPTANAGADTTFCQGFCTVLGATNVGSGGSGPYQYLWSPTVGLNANNTAHPLACPNVTTVYTVQVTDSNGCVASDNVTVTVRPNPTADAGVDRSMTSCSGDSVQIGGSPAASGGTPAYTYNWSPATGLSGTSIANPYVRGITTSQLYSLTVTDANGCSSVDVAQVAVVPSTLSAEAGNNASICAGGGASVTIGGTPTAAGGTGPYVYTWSPATGLSSATAARPVASPTATTKYYLTVTDSKGCMAYDSVTIRVNPTPLVNPGFDTAICAGQRVQLGGRPAAGGGSAPYTYNWTPGTGLSGTTISNPVATPSTTTTYVLSVTDSNGCVGTGSVTITVRPNPIADAGPDKTLVACSGDSVRIGGSPSASGGTIPYTYIWSPTGGLTCTGCSNPYVKNLGSSATYTLTVRDTFGCSASDQVLVNVTGNTLVAEAGNNVAFCQGAAVSVTLGGNPTAVGGSAPYNYTWSPNANLSASNTANPVASPTSTTTYNVVVRDANGCIASDTVRITINPRPVVNAGTNDTICANTCIALGGSPTATGGTGSTYTYAWTPAFFFSTPTNVANPTVCPTNNITYTVNVTDSIGCNTSANVTIKVNQNPLANAGADKSVTYCANACVTLGGSPTATNGTAPYSYAWSPSTALNNTGLPNPTACNVSVSNTYTLTVTDANGCTSTDQVLINSTASTLHADAGLDATICAGQSNCITIGGNPAVSGGTGPYNITWSPLAGICNSNTIANPQVNPTDTTKYVLLVTDAQGCISADSMNVIVNPAVTASVGPDTFVCNGGSVILGGNPTASGGTPGYSYTWSPGVGLSGVGSSNPTASPSVTTSYCVTVTDAVGCTASTCQRLTVNPAITANAGPDQTITSCSGSYAIIGGSPTGVGGSGNYTYHWSPDSVGGVRVVNGVTLPNPIVTNLTVTTTFTVTVTDNASGCSATDQVVITVNPTTLTVDAGLDKIYCANSSSPITIGGSPTATGGQSPYIYQWAPISGLNDGNVANPAASPIVTTTYVVTVTDNLGCSKFDSMTVFVSPYITVNAGVDTAICYGTNVVLGGNPVAVGGTGSYHYAWSPSQYLTGTTVAHPTAQNVTSNISYTLVVTDSLGCAGSDIVVINTRALPSANAGPDATLFACTADSAIIGGSPTASGTVGPYTYSWNPPLPTPPTGANPVVKNLGFTTQFTVTVTDSFGCKASDDVLVTVVPNTLFVDAGSNIPNQCANQLQCVTLGGAVLGGTPPYTYMWLGAVSNDSVSNPQACPPVTTTYTEIVTDSRGCQATDTVRVVVNTPPTANISGLSPNYCINSGNVTLTGIPAGGTFSGPGMTGNVFQPAVIGAGLWTIRYVYTDPSTGCTDDTSISVTVNPLPVVGISGNNVSYCRYEMPDTLVGTPAGGTFTGAGMVGNVFTPANANVGNNTITYTYTDTTTGCSNSAQVVINVKAAPTLSVTASRDTACVGQSVVLSPNYSVDVTNIQWSLVGGGIFTSGLTPITVTPTGVDYCVVATAVNNPNGCTATDTVCLHVNQPPVANTDTANTCEEQPIAISVMANDTDPEGDSSVVTVLSANHGTTTVTGGVVNYTPSLNYNGFDTLVYSLCNVQCTNACDTATAYISICPINDPPVITDVVDTIYQNHTDTVCPMIVDVDGDSLSIALLGCYPVNGTVALDTNNCVVFTPTYNWVGTQVICVVACDNSGACDTGTVTIVVLPGNHAPRTVKINATVCHNTPIGINVAAGATDQDGDPLTFSYGAISGPAGSIGVLNVTGNGAVVFQADSAGIYNIPYYVCDQSNLPVYSLCDTNVITVRVILCDSTNHPPVATDDATTVLVNDTVTVNELANDFDPDGDPLTVTILNGPYLPGATATLNPDGTVTYTSPTVGEDSITYAVCDPYGLCDTATIFIYVDSVLRNHPPVAVNDFGRTPYITPITVPVMINDHDPDGNPITLTSIPCAPLYGTATITGTTIYYQPGPLANANQPDTFCYVICDNGAPVLCDTATVVIFIENSVVAVNDSVGASPYTPRVIPVMNNDYDPETDSFFVTTFITTNTVGGVTLNTNGTVTYTPAQDTCGFVDSFQYVIQDVHGAVDTATVYINVFCCTLPIANNDSATVIPGVPYTVNLMSNDNGFGFSLNGSIVTLPHHGTAMFASDSVLVYTPDSSYCGLDTVVYAIKSGCGSDTALFVIDVHCNIKPVATDDAFTMCDNSTSVFDVLANDTDANGDSLTITQVTQPAFGLGLATIDSNKIKFNSTTFTGPITLNYVICDNGLPVACDTGTLLITVTHCEQFAIKPVFDTTCIATEVTTCLGSYVTSNGLPFTITQLCNPQNGVATIAAGDTCITYTPNSGYTGTDTFCVTVCDNGGNCASTTVSITTIDCLLDAIDDPCDINSTTINTPLVVDVLANDIIPQAADTVVTINGTVDNATVIVNTDHTLTVIPNSGYVGNIQFTYQVCTGAGNFITCDTANVCVNVIDTNCFIPNAFSPNGDGVNDEYDIECLDQFPQAKVSIYDRWGVEVWISVGEYSINKFKGENMQGTKLPDGTYYAIIEYNDGTGRRDQKFIVIHR